MSDFRRLPVSLSLLLASTPVVFASGIRIAVPVKTGGAIGSPVPIQGGASVRSLGDLSFPVGTAPGRMSVLPSVGLRPTVWVGGAEGAQAAVQARPDALALPVSPIHRSGLSERASAAAIGSPAGKREPGREGPQSALSALRHMSSIDASNLQAVGKAFDNSDFNVDAAVPQKWSSVSGRKLPAVKEISFAEGVSAEHRGLFQETLTRRKAGWYRGIAAAGMNLLGSHAPTFRVTEAADAARGTAVAFTVEWEQGERNLGAFRAVVSKEKLEPSIRRLAAPKAAPETIFTLQFLTGTPQADIDSFLEAHGLRLLHKDWTGLYKVAATGGALAADVAAQVSGKGIVFYASPDGLEVAEEDQFRFKLRQDVLEKDVSEFLRANGLRVIEKDRDGVNYRVGVTPGASTEKTVAALTARGIVLFASPVKSDIAEDREVILQFRQATYGKDARPAASEAEIVRVLRGAKLRVLADLGDGAFRVAAAKNIPGRELAGGLAGREGVASAVDVGAATDETVSATARSVAAYKGRPWSSTEYNMQYHYAYRGLVVRGATKAQLKEFARLTAEAPIRGGSFNPWSGD